MNISEGWTSLPSMKTKRFGCAAVKMGGQIYVIGGKNRKKILSSMEIYSPPTRKWSPLPSMSRERFGCAAVEIDGLLYIIGGDDERNSFLSMEIYNPMSRKWSLIESRRTKRCCSTAVEMDGLIYVIGGYNGGTCFSSVETYNPKTRQWGSLLSLMHTKRSLCAAVKMGGLIYVMGGVDGCNHQRKKLSSVEIYNPKTEQWSFLPSMGSERSACAAVKVAGQIYVIGGHDGSDCLSSVEMYNAKTNLWSFLPSMPTKRNYCAAVEIEERIYVIGGFDGKNNNSSTQVFCVQQQQQSFQSSCNKPQHAPVSLTSCGFPSQGSMQNATLATPMIGSDLDKIPTSQFPRTMQLFQNKFPTGDFAPVAAEVSRVEEMQAGQPLTTAKLVVAQDLPDSTTEEICQWLSSKHGISEASLKIIRHEECDGIFFFNESIDEIKKSLREDGIMRGQIARICSAVEKAKKEGSLI